MTVTKESLLAASQNLEDSVRDSLRKHTLQDDWPAFLRQLSQILVEARSIATVIEGELLAADFLLDAFDTAQQTGYIDTESVWRNLESWERACDERKGKPPATSTMEPEKTTVAGPSTGTQKVNPKRRVPKPTARMSVTYPKRPDETQTSRQETNGTSTRAVEGKEGSENGGGNKAPAKAQRAIKEDAGKRAPVKEQRTTTEAEGSKAPVKAPKAVKENEKEAGGLKTAAGKEDEGRKAALKAAKKMAKEERGKQEKENVETQGKATASEGKEKEERKAENEREGARTRKQGEKRARDVEVREASDGPEGEEDDQEDEVLPATAKGKKTPRQIAEEQQKDQEDKRRHQETLREVDKSLARKGRQIASAQRKAERAAHKEANKPPPKLKDHIPKRRPAALKEDPDDEQQKGWTFVVQDPPCYQCHRQGFPCATWIRDAEADNTKKRACNLCYVGKKGCDIGPAAPTTTAEGKVAKAPANPLVVHAARSREYGGAAAAPTEVANQQIVHLLQNIRKDISDMRKDILILQQEVRCVGEKVDTQNVPLNKKLSGIMSKTPTPAFGPAGPPGGEANARESAQDTPSAPNESMKITRKRRNGEEGGNQSTVDPTTRNSPAGGGSPGEGEQETKRPRLMGPVTSKELSDQEARALESTEIGGSAMTPWPVSQVPSTENGGAAEIDISTQEGPPPPSHYEGPPAPTESTRQPLYSLSPIPPRYPSPVTPSRVVQETGCLPELAVDNVPLIQQLEAGGIKPSASALITPVMEDPDFAEHGCIQNAAGAANSLPTTESAAPTTTRLPHATPSLDLGSPLSNATSTPSPELPQRPPLPLPPLTPTKVKKTNRKPKAPPKQGLRQSSRKKNQNVVKPDESEDQYDDIPLAGGPNKKRRIQ